MDHSQPYLFLPSSWSVRSPGLVPSKPWASAFCCFSFAFLKCDIQGSHSVRLVRAASHDGSQRPLPWYWTSSLAWGLDPLTCFNDIQKGQDIMSRVGLWNTCLRSCWHPTCSRWRADCHVESWCSRRLTRQGIGDRPLVWQGPRELTSPAQPEWAGECNWTPWTSRWLWTWTWPLASAL